MSRVRELHGPSTLNADLTEWVPFQELAFHLGVITVPLCRHLAHSADRFAGLGLTGGEPWGGTGFALVGFHDIWSLQVIVITPSMSSPT